MVQSKAFELIQDMKERLKTRWDDFIAMLKQKSDPDDPEQVFVDDFKAILNQFRLKLSTS